MLRVSAIIVASGILATLLSFASWNLMRLGEVEPTQFEYVAKDLWQGGIIISFFGSIVWLCLRQRSNKKSGQRIFLFTLAAVLVLSLIIRVLKDQAIAYIVLQTSIVVMTLTFAYSCMVLLEIKSRPEAPR